MVRDQIGSLFETRFLGKELDGVPEDINVLLIVHPKNTSEKTLFSIDQYLLAGGKAIIFVDPFAETEAMQGQMMRPSIEVARELFGVEVSSTSAGWLSDLKRSESLA